MHRNLAPFYEKWVTLAESVYEKEVSEKTKGLKRKAENDQLVTRDDASLPKRSVTSVDTLKERINMLEEEVDMQIQDFINNIKSNITTNGDCGSCMQKTLDLRKPAVKKALWDPNLENALVLYTPPKITEEQKLSIDEKDRLFYVSVGPLLRNMLRPHQMEGVKFMYDCVTGLKIENNYGCILADEMGLGKTLQCITLVWTLLRQGLHGTSTINKAIIVCPSNLVDHWEEEFTKWLGDGVSIMVIGSEERKEIGNNLTTFVNDRSFYSSVAVVIISYETLRMYADILNKGEIGIVICDEGHRLKNSRRLIYKDLMSLKCSRKIIVSNTPIQNDLLEWYNLIDFVNPGLLEPIKEFRKKFKIPIVKGTRSSSNEEQQKLGKEKIEKLWNLISPCVIRRTSDLITQYLSEKYEFVVCCSITKLQENLYKQLLSTKKTIARMKNRKDILQSLSELCNHPQLIYDRVIEKKSGFKNCQFPPLFKKLNFDPGWSSKMLVLDYLLISIKRETNDKIVIVSNYHETLNLLVKLCTGRKYKYLRLDCSTPVKQRGEVVKEFNNSESGIFIFLLSSKAGRCGLNLIGANRLVMFDPDWNPANDEQAMARIWRNGQTKTCFIYRFFGTGTIEERILQRQIEKKVLSSCVVDGQTEVGRNFGTGKSESLFELRTSTNSDTHDKLECKRCVNGEEVENPPDGANTKSDLSLWHHITKKNISKIPDDILKGVLSIADIPVSFIFYQKSHKKEVQKESGDEKDCGFKNKGDDFNYDY